MALGQFDTNVKMAYRLLYQEPRAERRRRRKQEQVIMEWTLFGIEPLRALLVAISFYLL